jgi:hypothetical protein
MSGAPTPEERRIDELRDRALPYAEEPTPHGIQYVIPGCEKAPTEKTRQGSLW